MRELTEHPNQFGLSGISSEPFAQYAMGETRGDPADERYDASTARRGVDDTLANARRRTTLSIVADRSEPGDPVPESALAESVWAAENDAPPETAPDAELERVLIDLHHCHLPKLETAGLVVRTDGAVESVPSKLLASAVDAAEGDSPPDPFDRPIHRAAVDALSAEGGQLYLAELAVSIASAPSSPATAERDAGALAVILHHIHLPTLERAGVVSYEPDRKRVRLEAGPAR